MISLNPHIRRPIASSLRSSIPLLLVLLLAPFIATTARSQTLLLTRNVVTGLETPWEILWGPDNWIWVSERTGRISRVNPETGKQVVLLSMDNVFESDMTETGLLGMALHPRFDRKPWVYVSYTYKCADDTLFQRLSRFVYNGARLTDESVLLDSIPASVIHNGSRLAFLPDGTLIMTIGDAWNEWNAQRHTSLSGKTLRLNENGWAPPDNPYPKARRPFNLIWTTGHRNQQGLVVAPNGLVYTSEHGPEFADEINILQGGRNYGWPYVKGWNDSRDENKFTADSAALEPLQDYSPTAAVAGLDFYDSPAIPEWRNSLLQVCLREQTLHHLKLSDDGRAVLDDRIIYYGTFHRLRDLCISPDGRVFLATSNRDGRYAPEPEDDRIIEVKGVQIAAVDDASSRGTEKSITPHPVRDLSYVLLGRTLAKGRIEIHAVDGRLVRSEPFAGGDHYQFKRGDIQPGVYVLSIIDEKNRVEFRVMVE